jgi:hypothetical protein
MPPPTAPTIGIVTQPICALPTGSVVLNNLPVNNWTITIYPGITTISGTGISTTISGLAAGTYNFTVTNSFGLTSTASSNVVIPVVKSGIIPTIRSKWSNVLICSNIKDSIVSYIWYKNSSTITGATGQYYVTNKQVGVYKVETIDKSGCKNSSNIISISGAKSLSVYPNPASVSFAVRINGEDEGNAIVTVLNASGTKVMEFQAENLTNEPLKEIPVSNLDDGIYIIRVLLNNKELYYTKIIIKK